MSYRVCWLIRQRSLTVPSNTWWGSELIRNQYDAYWNKQIERFRGLQKRTTFEWRLTLKIKSNLSLQIWKTVTFRSLRVSISASVYRPSEEHHVFRSGSTQFLLRAPDFSPHSKLFFPAGEQDFRRPTAEFKDDTHFISRRSAQVTFWFLEIDQKSPR